MTKFRKKPAHFEADQWQPGKAVAGVQTDETGRAFVMTAHGQPVYLTAGDWVVAEPQGRGYYPIKPDIMTQIADPVED